MISHRALVSSMAAILGVLALGISAGLRVNLSPSLPMGLWLMTPVTHPIITGDIVQLCPPAVNAKCSHVDARILKPVVATSGDLVVVSVAGVAVNGQLIEDSVGVCGASPACVPFGVNRLAEDELWVLSTHHPKSFDSRYFGAVKRFAVRSKARPILVWK